jgi:hypothetical protein
VVWDDRRCGGQSCRDVYGARLTETAGLLDADGIAISTAESAQAVPAVAPEGTGFLVVWSDFRSLESWAIQGARIDSEGIVIDPEGLLLAEAEGFQFAPALAGDAGGHLLTWEDGRCGGAYCSDVYASRLGPGALSSDLGGNLLGASADAQFDPAVASSGARHLVVWEDASTGDSDIYGAILVEGDPGGPGERFAISLAPGDQRLPAVSWDGEAYLIVWEDHRSGQADVVAARVGAAGEVLDEAPIPISVGPLNELRPVVAWTGASHLAVWLDARNGLAVFAARITPGGAVLDPEGIRVAGASDGQGRPAVACGEANCLAAWTWYGGSSNYDIQAARLDAEGTVLDLDPIVVVAAPLGQSHPSAAWNGSHYLVAWQDFRSGASHDLYAARVSPEGALPDGQGVPIAVAQGSQLTPSVVWDGTGFLVLWEDARGGAGSDVYAARVGGTGALIPEGTSGLAVTARTGSEQSVQGAPSSPGQIVVVYDRFVPPPGEGAQRVFARVLAGCLQDGVSGGADCAFDPISPPDRASLPASGQPPTFWWGPGSLTRFRVEFSADDGFRRRVVRSRGKLDEGTSYVPTPEKWSAIRMLAPDGGPIYWRIVGKESGSRQKSVSDPIWVFTVEGP